MDMGYPRHQSRRRKYRWQRCLAAWLVLCLLLGNMNFEIMLTYATESRVKTFEIGADVTAELKDGVLTVKGHGDTKDFTEDTAPFLEYAEEIRSLSIENGITYIGSYLFYGLGELRGELKLPESIVGFGDYAFSGKDWEHAPHFSSILNEFEEGEIVGHTQEEATAATPSQATSPSQAASPSQASEAETAEIERHAAPRVGDSPEQADGSAAGSADGSEAGQEENSGGSSMGDAADAADSGDSQADVGGTSSGNGNAGADGASGGNGQTGAGSQSGNDQTDADSAGGGNENPAGTPSGNGQIGADGAGGGNGDPAGTPSGDDQTGADGTGDGNSQTGNGGITGDEENVNTSGSSTDAGSEETGEAGPEGGAKDENTTPPAESGENTETILETEAAAGASGGTSSSTGSGKQQGQQNKEIPLEEETEYDIEFIFEQKIENPDTLFYEGQSGYFVCFPDNGSFIEAAESAGYQLADGIITATLDDTVDLELPALEGSVLLPECPQEINGPYEENEFFKNEFAGWIVEGQDSGTPQAPGDPLDVPESGSLALYSVWDTVGTYDFQVESERQGDTAVYKLTDRGTGETPEVPYLYEFLYQWQ